MSACPMCKMRPCRCFIDSQAKLTAQAKSLEEKIQSNARARVEALDNVNLAAAHLKQSPQQPEAIVVAIEAIADALHCFL